jgi:hypothetical protein
MRVCVFATKGDTREDMSNFSAFATFIGVEKFAYVTLTFSGT